MCIIYKRLKIAINKPKYIFAVLAVHHTCWGSMLKILRRVLFKIILEKSFVNWMSLFTIFRMNVSKVKSLSKQNVTHKDPSDSNMFRALYLCLKENSIATKSSPHFINVLEIFLSVCNLRTNFLKSFISLFFSSVHIAFSICCRIFSFVHVSSGFFRFLIRYLK